MKDANLWGFDEQPVDDIETPAAILKRQEQGFNGVMREKGLYAEFFQRAMKDSSRLGFGLDIIAPGLNDYKFRVVSISFDIKCCYPVRVASEFGSWDGVGGEVEDENALIEAFKEIFQSKSIRTVISSLIANSNL